MKNKYLVLVALVAAACTPMTIVRSAAWSIGAPARASDVDPDELYWNPAVISNENCPEISGKFRVPPLHFSYEFFFNTYVSGTKKEGKKAVPVEIMLSIKSISGGIESRAQSEAVDVTNQRLFDKRFGCANGEYVVRFPGAYTGGGDTFTCTALSYSETHWKLDQNQNLVVNTVQRNPCWLDRGKSIPSREVVFPSEVYKRIGNAALD